MKCPQCGAGKMFCYGTKPFQRADGQPFVRRCRLCDACGAAIYTAEVPIQMVMPEHPACLQPGGKDRPAALPKIT